MTLTKAIEILTEIAKPGIVVYDGEDMDALQLAIEALKEKAEREERRAK